MPKAKAKPKHDFTQKLARTIEPKGGPGVELVTLEDAAKFIGLMKPWRQRRLHWEYAAQLVLLAGETGRRSDIGNATAQMERALKTDNWL
jgi:hypothetical protein